MIYKSEEGHTMFRRIYDEALDKLDLNPESRQVSTRFGETHVLVFGPEDAPPLVMLHGGNTVSAETHAWYIPLAKQYRVYAPDLIGHPGRSAQVQLSTKDLSYGYWASDVVRSLRLGPVPFMGTSYGGSIVLCTAAADPEVLSKAILVMSGSIAMASNLSMASKVIWPYMSYRLFGGRKRLERFLRRIMDEPSETNIDVMAAVFKYLKMNDLIPLLTDEQIACCDVPTLVFAAEHDIFFPGRKVLERVNRVFPQVVGAELLANSRHYPSPEQKAFINRRIHEFLQE